MNKFQKAAKLLKDPSLPIIQRAKEYQRLHGELVDLVASYAPNPDLHAAAQTNLDAINSVARELFVPHSLHQ